MKENGTVASATSMRRLRDDLAAGRLPSQCDREWLVTGFDHYIQKAAEGVTLDKALGLQPRPGQRKWYKVNSRAARDVLLREMAKRFFPDLSIAEQAAEIVNAAARYETSRWTQDIYELEPPLSYSGTIKWYLFKAMKCDKIPKHRQIANILQDADCDGN